MPAPEYEKKALILSKWAEYKARVESVGMKPVQAQFVEESKKPGNEEWRTNIGTLRNYLNLNPSRRKDGDPHSQSHTHGHTHGHHIVAIPDSPEAIKEQMRKLQDAYKMSLHNKVSKLEADIENLEAQLKRARADLAACGGKAGDSML